MKIEFVRNAKEREELHRVTNAYSDMIGGLLSKDDWNNDELYPRKVWIDFVEDNEGGSMPFMVLDNRTGDCFEEDFATLDGAILYATDVHTTTEHQDEWDYMGAVKDRGGVDEDVKKRYVVSMAINGRVDVVVEAETPEQAFQAANIADADMSKMDIVDDRPVNCYEVDTGKLTDY